MTERFKAILVDDERLARKELRSMLADHDNIEVIGEAQDIDQAIALIKEREPHEVFLDIQMPGGSGFNLLEKVEANFKVIFVTAFDVHAIRAFEVNALDYLLKPINPERLAQAVDRLSSGEPANRQPQRRLEYEDRLFIEVDDRSRFVKVSDIIFIAAAGDYSEIVTRDGPKSLVLKPLKEWEERLPEKHFTRIHRASIVNLDYVEKVEGWFNRSYRIYLQRVKEPLIMSRRYAARLKTKFG